MDNNYPDPSPPQQQSFSSVLSELKKICDSDFSYHPNANGIRVMLAATKKMLRDRTCAPFLQMFTAELVGEDVFVDWKVHRSLNAHDEHLAANCLTIAFQAFSDNMYMREMTVPYGSDTAVAAASSSLSLTFAQLLKIQAYLPVTRVLEWIVEANAASKPLKVSIAALVADYDTKGPGWQMFETSVIKPFEDGIDYRDILKMSLQVGRFSLYEWVIKTRRIIPEGVFELTSRMGKQLLPKFLMKLYEWQRTSKIGSIERDFYVKQLMPRLVYYHDISLIHSLMQKVKAQPAEVEALLTFIAAKFPAKTFRRTIFAFADLHWTTLNLLQNLANPSNREGSSGQNREVLLAAMSQIANVRNFLESPCVDRSVALIGANSAGTCDIFTCEVLVKRFGMFASLLVPAEVNEADFASLKFLSSCLGPAYFGNDANQFSSADQLTSLVEPNDELRLILSDLFDDGDSLTTSAGQDNNASREFEDPEAHLHSNLLDDGDSISLAEQEDMSGDGHDEALLPSNLLDDDEV